MADKSIWSILINDYVQRARIDTALKFYTNFSALQVTGKQINSLTDIKENKGYLIKSVTKITDKNKPVGVALYFNGDYKCGDAVLKLDNLHNQQIYELSKDMEPSGTFNAIDREAADLGFDFYAPGYFGDVEKELFNRFLEVNSLKDVEYTFPTPDKIDKIWYVKETKRYWVGSNGAEYTLDYFKTNFVPIEKE